MATDIHSLAPPVERLIRGETLSEDAAKLQLMLKASGGQARFTGDFSLFNPLLELAAEDPVKFRSVIRYVMRKRLETDGGVTPLRKFLAGQTEGEAAVWYEINRDTKLDRNRRYVSDVRQYLRRLVDIENMQRYGADQLVGVARLQFMNEQWARWSARRVAALDAAAEAYGRRSSVRARKRLSREQTEEVTGAFWQSIEAELDALEQQVREKIRRK